MKPYAWKFSEDGSDIIYKIQFDEVPWKMRKVLLDTMKDWHTSGVGWHKTSGNQIFIFDKSFASQEAWEAWASRFPLEIIEKRYWGDKQKVVIHGKKRK